MLVFAWEVTYIKLITSIIKLHNQLWVMLKFLEQLATCHECQTCVAHYVHAKVHSIYISNETLKFLPGDTYTGYTRSFEVLEDHIMLNCCLDSDDLRIGTSGIYLTQHHAKIISYSILAKSVNAHCCSLCHDATMQYSGLHFSRHKFS